MTTNIPDCINSDWRRNSFKNGKPIIYFLIFLAAFFIQAASFAQTPASPADCKTGCTSNDVQIQRAYLSNSTGARLASSFVCPNTGVANVYLTLELTTKTPRVGVVIYANIKSFSGGVVGTVPLTTKKECFGTTLNQPTNKVTFQGSFGWTCGTPIVLTDVFIGWGTGNTDFCAGSAAFRCPATSSKCFSLPPENYIPVEIPLANPASDNACTSTPGGSTASFNLSNYEATVKGSQSNVSVSWFSDADLNNAITGTGITNFSANVGATEVYAKVYNNSEPTAYQVSIVTLTVYQTPTATTTSGTSCSDAGGGSTATFNLNTLAATVKGSQTDVTVNWFSNSALTTGITPDGAGNYSSATATIYARVVNNTATKCSSSVAVNLTVNRRPANPVVDITGSPTCGNASGTITVTSPLDVANEIDYEYKLNSGNWGDVISFSVDAGNSYTVYVRNKAGSCEADAGATGTMSAQPSAPPAAKAIVTENVSCSSATGKVRIVQDNETSSRYSTAVYEFSNNGTAWGSNDEFTFTAGGGYNLRVRRKSDNSCLASTTCVNSNNEVPATITQSSGMREALITTQHITIPESKIAVKAFPNPFSDRIRFVVTVPESGRGSLELFNQLGQKVKTVHQGVMNKGIQTFEFNVPIAQRSTLIYVLRQNDQKITGKLLSWK